MTPAKLAPIVIRRGLSWPGVVYVCYEDTAFTTPKDLTGWVPAMTAMDAPGKTVKVTFALSLGETTGQVINAPMTGVQTAALPLGNFEADLCFVDSDGNKVGPYGRAPVKVEDVNTIPT